MSTISFEYLIDNIEVIKGNYLRSLSPFFDRKMAVLYKRFIYSYKVAEWKKDKVWEYLNDDIECNVFIQIAKHLKK